MCAVERISQRLAYCWLVTGIPSLVPAVRPVPLGYPPSVFNNNRIHVRKPESGPAGTDDGRAYLGSSIWDSRSGAVQELFETRWFFAKETTILPATKRFPDLSERRPNFSSSSFWEEKKKSYSTKIQGSEKNKQIQRKKIKLHGLWLTASGARRLRGSRPSTCCELQEVCRAGSPSLEPCCVIPVGTGEGISTRIRISKIFHSL